MGTNLRPMKLTAHPVDLRCRLPSHFEFSSYPSCHALHIRYTHPFRMIHCVTSTTHIAPVPSPLVFCPKSFLPADSASDSLLEITKDYCCQSNQHCLPPVPLLENTNVAVAKDTRSNDLEKEPVADVADKTDSSVVLCGSRGIKRHTDQALWSPHQKKSRGPSYRKPSTDSNDVTAAKNMPILSRDIKSISEQILTICASIKQRKDAYILKMKLRDALYDIIKRLFPYCGLYVIGSSMNGFASSLSDMDLCLMLSHSEIDQKREAIDILHILRKSLQKCNFLRDLRIIHARVPILKFTDKISGLECDLNINNSVGIRNTHLLNAYSCLDWRLAPLVIFIKHWAKVQGINDASQGTISSYSLVLMILHYLQYGCDPPVLPSLQQKYPHKFNSSQDVRVLTLNQKLAPYSSPNQQSIGDLFSGFLHYFAYIFKFNEEVMSVRLGRTLCKDLMIQQLNQAGDPHASCRWRYLCIEEPFNLSNTAYSVHDAITFGRIKRVFQQSHELVRQTGDVQQIIKKSLVPF